MKLIALVYLIILFVVNISVKGQIERGPKIIRFPTDGRTHIWLNGNRIYTSTDLVNITSVNPRKEFFVWIQRQPPDDDFDFTIDEHSESPIIRLSSDTKNTAQTPLTVSRGHIISRSKRSQNCKPAITKCACRDVCIGDLIFEENFETLNMSKWHHEIRIASTDDFEFVSYQNRAENCYISNGQLHIIPGFLSEIPNFNNKYISNGLLDLRANCTANTAKECIHKSKNANIMPPIISARIRTKGSFQFRYGRVEVRAKLPKGDWLFPLILLEPAQNVYGPWDHASGQIRIAFAAGNEALFDNVTKTNIDGSLLLGGAVLTANQRLRRLSMSETRNKEHLGNDFHVYSVKWTDKSISLAIDGTEYGVISGGFYSLYDRNKIKHANRWKMGDYMAPFDQEFFITLGVAVGGHADFPDGSNNPITGKLKPWTNMDPKETFQFWGNRQEWQNTWKGIDIGLLVDYVRVYAL